MSRFAASPFLAALLTAAVAVAGCGGDDDQPAGTTAPKPVAAPPVPSTPDDISVAARQLIAPRLGFALTAWAARYTDADGRKPKFTWKGKQIADGSWQVSLVIVPEGEEPRKAIWTALRPLGEDPASKELAYVARPRNAEARRLARLPLASPADAGPIKLVVRVMRPKEATAKGFRVKLVGQENASVRAMAVDATGHLDNDLLRGFALLGEPPYVAQDVSLAKVTRYGFREDDSTLEDFLEYVGRVDVAYAVLTFEDDARRPKTVDELLHRPPTEVRIVRNVQEG